MDAHASSLLYNYFFIVSIKPASFLNRQIWRQVYCYPNRYAMSYTVLPGGRKRFFFYEWLQYAVESLCCDFNMICGHMAFGSLHGLAVNRIFTSEFRVTARKSSSPQRYEHYLSHLLAARISHISSWLVGGLVCWLFAFLSLFPKPKPAPQASIGTRPVRVVADHRSQVFQDLEVDRKKMSIAYSQGIV